MTFDKIDFLNVTLNNYSDDIIRKAEQLHSSFEDSNKIMGIMEKGSYLAEVFYKQTITPFNELRSKIGSNDERVKMLSEIISVTIITLVRFNCQHINVLGMSSDFKSLPGPEITTMQISIENSISLLEKIRPFEMSSRARNLLNETSTMANTAMKRLSKSGCFIATYIYQDFNSPEIYILRKFRDEKLRKSFIGRIVISIYYNISPKLINLFGHYTLFRVICKNSIKTILVLIK